MIQIATMMSDKVVRNMTKNGLREVAALGQNAMQRKKNEDGLTTIDSTSATQLGSAGAVMSFGLVAAAVANISGNTTEPGHQPYRFVAHPFQMKDIYDQFTAPVGAPAAVVMAAMPPGVNGYVFAAMYGRAVGTAASAVLLGTVLSLLTITVWLALLGGAGM